MVRTTRCRVGWSRVHHRVTRIYPTVMNAVAAGPNRIDIQSHTRAQSTITSCQVIDKMGLNPGFCHPLRREWMPEKTERASSETWTTPSVADIFQLSSSRRAEACTSNAYDYFGVKMCLRLIIATSTYKERLCSTRAEIRLTSC